MLAKYNATYFKNIVEYITSPFIQVAHFLSNKKKQQFVVAVVVLYTKDYDNKSEYNAEKYIYLKLYLYATLNNGSAAMAETVQIILYIMAKL